MGGVIFITTPDTEIIPMTGLIDWGHWNMREHRVYWGERKLLEELFKIGFKIRFYKKNLHKRFMYWNDLHILATKPYTKEDE